VSFYKDKIISGNDKFQSSVNYSAFLRTYENTEYLFLLLTKGQAMIFPKKYFTSEQIEFIKSKINSQNLESKN